MQLGAGADIFDLGDLDEVVDSFAIVFEVKAGVLEGDGELDDGLANLVNLLMGGDLLYNCSVLCISFLSSTICAC